MADTLRLALLGGLEITRDGAALHGFESRKARALLCYLAVEGRPRSRDMLAGLFWGELPEARAQSNLRRVLTNLRRVLASPAGALPHLLITRQTVEFNRESDYWLDVEEFEEAIGEGRKAKELSSLIPRLSSLRAAVELYRGDFLEGFFLKDCPAFEEWVMIERERLRQMALQALHSLAAHHAARGEYAAGIDYAIRLLTLDPWREEAHWQMMLLLALSGQHSAALVQYETCRRILADELGVEPTEETTALYERIRARELKEQVEEEPSSPPFPFVGREEEHAWLVRQWEAARGGTGRFTLVEGEAGIGKTRLVEEVLHYVAESGALLLHGRCYEFGTDLPYQPIAAALRSALNVERATLNVLPDVWLAELTRLVPEMREIYPDLPEPLQASGEAARQRLFEAAARLLEALVDNRQSAIVFLDDLHWADQSTVDLLRYLLHRLRQAPLWFVGAYRREEMDLDHPFLLLRRALGQEERVALLRLPPLKTEAITRLTHALPGLDDDQAQQLAAYLSRKSEGNPFILSQILQSLEEQGVLQTTDGEWQLDPTWSRGQRSGEEANSSVPFGVREMILGRVGRLPPPARRLLYLAAVIGEEFDLPLLRMAVGEDPQVVDESVGMWLARRLVRGARRASTARLSVSTETSTRPHKPESGSHVYDFTHDMIRQVVYESLPLWRRQRLHAQVAVALERFYEGQEEVVVEQLAHHYTGSGDRARALTYLPRAAEQAEQSYAWDAAIRCYSQALAFLPLDDLEAQYDILACRERAYNMAARREAQDADLRALENLAKDLDDDERWAEVFCRRTEWALRTGCFAMGIEMARQAADLAQRCARPDIAAESLRQGARCWDYQGHYDQARRWGQQALTFYTEQGDRRGRALALGNLGIIALSQGFLEEAQSYMEETVAEWQTLGDTWRLASSLNNLSMLYHRLGDYGRALTCQLEAHQLAPQTGDLDLDAHSLTSLGIIYHALGQYGEALAAYREALAQGRAAADRKIECYTLLCQAHTLLASGQVTQAEERYRQSLTIQEELDIPVFRAETLNGLADCLLTRGETEKALALLGEAEASFQEVDQSGISETLVRQAEAHAASGNLEEARQAVERFLATVEQPGSREAPTPETWWRAGGVLRACGDEAQARRMLDRADRLLKEQAARLTDPDLRRSFLGKRSTLSNARYWV
ncbi:MAG: tetratricopeptide repeat protein [Anaerolineae bacterium]